MTNDESAPAKKVQPKSEKKPNAKSQEPKAKQEKAATKGSKGSMGSKVQEAAPEVTLSATKQAPAYTEASLMAAFAEVAKATKLTKESRTALEGFLKAIINKAKVA